MSKTKAFYYFEQRIYPSITHNLEAMTSLIQKRHNRNDNCIRVKISWETQKIGVPFVNKESRLVMFSLDLWPIFGSDVYNGMGNSMRWIGPLNQLFGYKIFRILSLMIHNDTVE